MFTRTRECHRLVTPVLPQNGHGVSGDCSHAHPKTHRADRQGLKPQLSASITSILLRRDSVFASHRPGSRPGSSCIASTVDDCVGGPSAVIRPCHSPTRATKRRLRPATSRRQTPIPPRQSDGDRAPTWRTGRRVSHQTCESEEESWRADEWKLKKDMLPAWRHVPVKDIRRADVVALFDTIADPDGRNAPQSAVHVRRLLSKMFNFCARARLRHRVQPSARDGYRRHSKGDGRGRSMVARLEPSRMGSTRSGMQATC